ncbi:MAG: HU family DNA-binding protein, partial [Desulfobacteraceae bacterium]|nr:HU family DNA-binding protein [Desulfobacteraceae bacterium]
MALTKNDIVTSVHELGFTKKKSVEIIETLLEIMKSTLEKSEDVLISGFGKFCV